MYLKQVAHQSRDKKFVSRQSVSNITVLVLVPFLTILQIKLLMVTYSDFAPNKVPVLDIN